MTSSKIVPSGQKTQNLNSFGNEALLEWCYLNVTIE